MLYDRFYNARGELITPTLHGGRENGVGGSEVGAIIGVNNYMTPLDVYRSKREKLDAADNKYMLRGRRLEHIVAQYFEDEGYTIEKNDAVYIDGEIPIFRATADYIATNSNGERGVLECKTTIADYRENENPSYYTQLQWYLSCYKLNWGAIAYLGRDYEFYYKIYRRDDDYIAYLREEVIKFWREHIETGNPPEPKGVPDLLYLYPKQITDKIVDVPLEIYNDYQRLKSIDDNIKKLQTEKDTLLDNFKLMLRDGERLQYGDIKLISWKARETKRLDIDRIKNEMPEIYDKFLKVSSTRFIKLY